MKWDFAIHSFSSFNMCAQSLAVIVWVIQFVSNDCSYYCHAINRLGNEDTYVIFEPCQDKCQCQRAFGYNPRGSIASRRGGDFLSDHYIFLDDCV